MDAIDRKILAALTRNGRASAAEIGEAVNLSVSACHRRIKLLEESGAIERYAAVVSRKALGYTHEFFVEITLNSQSDATLGAFETAAASAPEILECQLLTGSFDYFLRVVARGPDDYERLHRNVLAKLPGVVRIQSSLVLRTIRSWDGAIMLS